MWVQEEMKSQNVAQPPGPVVFNNVPVEQKWSGWNGEKTINIQSFSQ